MIRTRIIALAIVVAAGAVGAYLLLRPPTYTVVMPTRGDAADADEPTGSLDSVSSEQVFEILANLVRRAGKTVLAVTHDISIAERTDRRIELVDGRIARDKTQRPPPAEAIPNTGTAAV